MNTCIICWEDVPTRSLLDKMDFDYFMDNGICPKCRKKSVTPINFKKDLTDRR